MSNNILIDACERYGCALAVNGAVALAVAGASLAGKNITWVQRLLGENPSFTKTMFAGIPVVHGVASFALVYSACHSINQWAGVGEEKGLNFGHALVSSAAMAGFAFAVYPRVPVVTAVMQNILGGATAVYVHYNQYWKSEQST